MSLLNKILSRPNPKFRIGDIVRIGSYLLPVCGRRYSKVWKCWRYRVGSGNHEESEQALTLVTKRKTTLSKMVKMASKFDWPLVQRYLGSNREYDLIALEVAKSYKDTRDEEVLKFFRDYIATGNKESYTQGLEALQRYEKEVV